MKKIIFVLVFWIILGSSLFLGFITYTERSYGINKSEELESIDVGSDEVKNLVSALSTSDYLRDGYMQVDSLDDETIFKQILLSLDKQDYKDIIVRPVKIMCSVKSNLWFTSSDTCIIRVISNETIKEYEKRLFNTERDLEVNEITFKGYHCKFDKKYYCHMTYYKEDKQDYSFVDKAFKNKDEIVVYEYYLRVDYSDMDVCLAYYGEEFCNDKKVDIPEISKDIIIKNGVYYKHVFKKNALGEYYLFSSDVQVL